MRAFDAPGHRDGEVVGAGEVGAGEDWVWRTSETGHGILGFEFAPRLAPDAPPLWFVHVDEPRAQRPAAHLVGFSSEHLPAGTIISRYRFATLGVHSDEQVGAVNWHRSGVASQIFVARPWRRHQAAIALLLAADAFHQANAWPGFLHSDGRRTELGELMIGGLPYPQRISPLTETMPPMDLPD